MAGWQEGHLACKEIRSTNSQRFCSGTGAGGPERDLGDPVHLKKWAIKMDSSCSSLQYFQTFFINFLGIPDNRHPFNGLFSRTIRVTWHQKG